MGVRKGLVAAAVTEGLVVEGKPRRIACANDGLVGHRACRGLRGLGDFDQIAQQAAVEEDGVLQAQLDAELVGIVERDLGDQHLDHDHGGFFVEFRHQGLDLVVEPLGGADDQAVADELGDHDHLALDLFEGAEHVLADLLHLTFAFEKLVDCVGHVLGRRVFQTIDVGLAVEGVGGVQSQQDCFDHPQVTH